MGISKLQVALIGLLACSAGSVLGQQQQTAGNERVVSFLTPGRAAQAGALQQLGNQSVPPSGRARTALGPEERGQPSWGAYLTPTDSDGVSDGPTRVRLLRVSHDCLLCTYPVPCLHNVEVPQHDDTGFPQQYRVWHKKHSPSLSHSSILVGKCGGDLVSPGEAEFQCHPQ